MGDDHTTRATGLRLRWTPYGAPAYAALREVIAEIKHADPLAAVSLIVPTNLCGTVARRALAAGLGDGTAPGIAGITVLTVDRLAELLAAPRLTGEHRRPTTGPVLAAAWRSALADQPGLFAQVADHPATVTALVEAHRTLRDLTPDALDAVAATGSLPADVVRLHRDVVGRLSERWYDVTDLRAAASEVLTKTTHAGELGVVVVFLPQDLQANASRLLSALAARTEVHVIVGVAGDDHADAGVVRGIRRLTPADVPSTPAALPPATARRVMHASDADDEVRAVVREVVAALGTTPAHRIAVLFGSASPYARLLHEHLDAAGITVNGPGVRPTAERVLPRALLGLLALADGAGPDRAAVFRLLAAAPVRDQAGRLVPASRWERVSRSAGVTGPPSWTPRLTRFAAEKRRAAEEELTQDDPYQGRVDRLRRDAEAADALLAFVDDLRDSSLVGRMATTWSDLSRWSLGTFHAYLGDETTRHRLPGEEQRAAERVERILASLAGLDTVEEHASLTALREVVELELADDLPRVGRFGAGVLVAPLSAAVGLDADTVWVVGLAEGLCPGRSREDALLPDRARAAAGDALPAARERLDRQHRHLLAAFASGSDVTASFPRGDLRRSGGRLPSRWLLESLRALSGDATLSATEWDRRRGEWLVGSPSYASTVTSTPTPASDQEWRLRALLADSASRAAIARPDDLAYDRAVALQRARRSGAFTRFDGNLIALADTLTDPVNGSRPTSPTTLESWVVCPHAYFVRRMLRVEPVESPEDLLSMTPADRGTLMHAVLDQFFQWLELNGGSPAPGTPWTAEQREQLHTVERRVADEFEERGATGHPTMWRRDRTILFDDLDKLLGKDEEVRAGEGRRQVHSELHFGRHGFPPVEVTLSDGRVLLMAGSVDRVDAGDDGSLVAVDYKSGSAWAFKGLSEADPDHRGSKLQLPVYAMAARQALNKPHADVRGEYWFIGRKDRGDRVTFPVTAAVQDRYAHVLTTVVDGIAAGLFPNNPPEDQPWLSWVACAYCDPDGLGAAERRSRWDAKRGDPALAEYLALVEPVAPGEGGPA